MITLVSSMLLFYYLYYESPLASYLQNGNVFINGPILIVIIFFFTALITQLFLYLACRPQLTGEESPEGIPNLRRLSRSRIRPGSLDPDYRLQGWNQSQYAPKNRKNGANITQTAYGSGGCAALLIITPVFLVLGTFSSHLVYGAWVVFALSALIGGTLVRRAEWRRVKRFLESGAADLPDHVRIEAAIQAEQPPKITSARDFEKEVAWVFNKLSQHHAVVVGGAGDRGADIKIYNRSKRLVGVVQCKWYKPDKPLAPMYVREMVAVKQLFKVNLAYLVTTTRFTEDSRELGKELNIQLVDGKNLERMRRRAMAIERTLEEIK